MILAQMGVILIILFQEMLNLCDIMCSCGMDGKVLYAI